ncbi:MAG: three-Cys-motif partner protein TcmP [Ekhidna sp.]|nr:three-Cys-motif partner protein TcmP [Ekhidna sp.]
MEKFFKEQTPSSKIKANIVAEYFPQYSRILLKKPQKKIRYLDLFAGPGLYEDGSLSTPLLIADSCAKDLNLAQKVQLIFNDNQYAKQLEENFNERFFKNAFHYKPLFGDKTVGECEEVTEYLKKDVVTPNPHPTLLFFDPWGYKGIDTLVLAKFMENWGNEIFLFVNIKRIHSAIENNKFDTLMRSLFPTTFRELQKNRRYKATVYERLSLIMDNLADEFEKAVKSPLYHSAFKFQEEDSHTTSHFIIHFTKHTKGYELVKQVFYHFDNIGASLDKDGNYTFDAKVMGNSNEILNFGDQNIEALSQALMEKYKGQKITAKTLFDDHHPTTKFCGSHYVKTLRHMVDNGKIKSEFKDDCSHKVSVLLIDTCILQFN